MIKLFEEFVNISDYKEWSKYYNKDFYELMGNFFKKFDNHDKNYNRIYFDLKVDTNSFEIKIPDELSDFMRWYGYPIIDYQKGLCMDKDGREIRIGKLLNKLGEEKLLKTYNQSRTNILKDVNDLQVVICRHPYDLIGMSTGRGWTTCHDIHDKRYGGEHLHGLKNDLQKGILVAYLIRKSDRNINNPIARCLIFKSYGVNKIGVDRHIYGTKVDGFTELLNKFCNKFNRSKGFGYE